MHITCYLLVVADALVMLGAVHIVTACTCPALCTLSQAYDRTHVYSQDEIAKVIEFAKFRGIRVVNEFDTPVSKWVYAL